MKLLRIALAIVLPGLSDLSSAHDVHPPFIRFPPGGEDFVEVIDPSGCLADVTVTSLSSQVEVYAIDMATGLLIPGSGAEATVQDTAVQKFAIFADPALTTPLFTALTVCWIGVNAPPGPPGPCDENNCGLPELIPVEVSLDSGTIGAKEYAGKILDPVNTASGEKYTEIEPLPSLGGPFPLTIQLLYSSLFAREGNVVSALGPGWSHSFDWRLAEVGHNVEIFAPNGRVIRFERDYINPIWSLAVHLDVPFQLSQLVPPGIFMLFDPRDQTVRIFDGSGKLVNVSDGHGNFHGLAYSGSRLSSVIDALGRSFHFSYDGPGRLIGISDGFGRAAQLSFAGSEFASVQDAAGAITSFQYDGSGLGVLSKTTLPRGNARVEHQFDAQGRVAAETDAFGNAYMLAYGPPDSTTIAAPSGPPRTHVHADGVQIGLTDESGTQATIVADAFGRQVGFVDRLGDSTSLTIDPPSGYPASLTAADGSVTSFSYMPQLAAPGLTRYLLTRIDRANGSHEEFTYSGANLASWRDANGALSQWTYNSRGQPLSFTNALGGVTTFAYNGDFTLKSSGDPSGDTTQYSYDALKRLVSVTRADGSVVAITYDPMNRIATSTDSLGQVTAYGYDANGNSTSLTRPQGGVWAHSFDAMDRPDAETDPLGSVRMVIWDSLRRLAGFVDPLGNTTSVGHDVVGNVTSITMPSGATSTAAYDAEQVPSSHVNADGIVWNFGTDQLGRRTSATSTLGSEWRYDYDALGALVAVENPLDGVTSLSRDAQGLVDGITFPLPGMSVSFARNALGQITAVTDPDGFTRSAVRDNEGWLVSFADPLGRTTSIQRDSLGRVTGGTFPLGLGTFSVFRDAAGRILQRAYSDGTVIDFGWDANGNLVSGTGFSATYDAADRMSTCNNVAIARDAAGRITSLTLPSGRTIDYAYDADGNCTQITDPEGRTSTFTYTAAGKPSQILRPNGLVSIYGYDPSGRLVLITHGPSVTIDLSLDAAGQVTSADRTVPLVVAPVVGAQFFSHDSASQRLIDVYNGRGCCTACGSSTYSFDLAGRMTDFSSASGTHSLEWDCLGNPTQFESGGVARDFRWVMCNDGEMRLVEESENGVATWENVCTPDGELFCRVAVATGEAFYPHEDEAGNTICISDSSGAFTDAFCYSSHGTLLGRSGTTDWPQTYGGRCGTYALGDDLYLTRGEHGRTVVYDADNARTLSPIEPDCWDTWETGYLPESTDCSDTASSFLGGGADGEFESAGLMYGADSTDCDNSPCDLEIERGAGPDDQLLTRSSEWFDSDEPAGTESDLGSATPSPAGSDCLRDFKLLDIHGREIKTVYGTLEDAEMWKNRVQPFGRMPRSYRVLIDKLLARYKTLRSQPRTVNGLAAIRMTPNAGAVPNVVVAAQPVQRQEIVLTYVHFFRWAGCPFSGNHMDKPGPCRCIPHPEESR